MVSIIGRKIDVLDHGFVRVVDTMGDDSSIVQAARVSYGDGTKTVREDAELINYLVRNWHTSPAEMLELKLHVKLPIFVARQWVRHRTANINEYSGRYSVMKDEFYIPESERVTLQSTNNRQGGDVAANSDDVAWFLNGLSELCDKSYNFYQEAIDRGLARELARIGLPLNMYTEWYWKIDAHNLMRFLLLRMDSHAQYEIRVYAEAIGNLVEEWLPSLWSAFKTYILDSVTFSKKELTLLSAILTSRRFISSISQETVEDIARANNCDSMSKGEYREFTSKLNSI